MKQEFITAIEEAAEKLKQQLLQDARADWAATYSRLDLTPTEAQELAVRYVNNHLQSVLYLNSSKNLLK